MRRRRIKLEGVEAVYHCMSRTVSGTRLFDPQAKEVLRKMMWDAADFSGVRILAYCIMTNHFHILVRIPTAQLGLDREELLRRYRRLYAHDPSPGYPTPDELRRHFTDGGEVARQWEARLRERMGDVSHFMKTLKQRFSVWYNRNHERFGPLWAERFRSVLVENEPHVLRTVAAYIDLNPVRAHLVDDPSEYRWTSYAEAVGGNTVAQEGYRAILGENTKTRPWVYLADYRTALFEKGIRLNREGDGIVDSARAKVVAERKGRFTLSEMARHRIAQLTRGAVVGSPSFVRGMAKQYTVRTAPSPIVGGATVDSSPSSTSPDASPPSLVSLLKPRNPSARSRP